MTAKLWSHPTVGFFQVRLEICKISINAIFLDYDQATIEKEFEYKDCCKDSKGKVDNYD